MGYVAHQDSTDWATICQATIAGSTLASYSVESFSVDRLRDLTPTDIAARAEAFRAITHFPTLEIGSNGDLS